MAVIDGDAFAEAVVGRKRDNITDRVLAVAIRVVNDYAENAPDEVKNEAIIRFGGYLGIADFGTIRSEELGPQSFEHVVNHAPAFRNSGAMMLLTRYKKRRAGVI